MGKTITLPVVPLAFCLILCEGYEERSFPPLIVNLVPARLCYVAYVWEGWNYQLIKVSYDTTAPRGYVLIVQRVEYIVVVLSLRGALLRTGFRRR